VNAKYAKECYVQGLIAQGRALRCAGGDIILAGETSAHAWDDAAGAYTARRSTTWANLAATVASGGFGGNAHEPTHDVHVVDGL
jgi:hypothetical protein